MKLQRTMLLLACVGIGAALAQASVTLNAAYTTTAASDDYCNPGPKSSAFLTTTAQAWLYVSISNGAVGDVLEADYIRPDGVAYTALTYAPLPSAGSYCFDGMLAIANNQAANYPGTWTIKGYWNYAAMFTITFTISAPGGGSGTGAIVNFQSVLKQMNLAPGTYTSPTVLASAGLTIVANPTGTPGAAGTGSLYVQAVQANEVHPSGTATEAFFYGPGIGYNVLNCTTLSWTGSGNLSSFTITRPGMTSGSSIPAWAMYAYSSSGNQLATAGEGNLTSGGYYFATTYADFTVASTTPIARVVFCSHNGLSTYNALPLSGGTSTGGGGGGGSGSTVSTNNGCSITGNLLQNCGAEAGSASGFDGRPASIPGWVTDHNVGVTAYSDSGGDLTPTSPGPANRGNNYFDGGSASPDGPTTQISQTVDLTSSATAIDAGTQPYTLDGFLGGYDGQDDRTDVTATFQNASGSTLGTATIKGPNSSDRAGATELIEVSTSGTVPKGARKAVITVLFTRFSGSDNDGMADNLFFGLVASGGGGSGSGGTTVYYRFENGSANATASGAGSIVDSSGAGQNGTPSGSLTYSSDVPVATLPLNGTADALSLQFGSSGVVQNSSAFPLNSLSAATMEFWIKPTGSSSEMDFLWTRSDSSDANRFNMGVLTSGSSRTIFFDYRETNGTLHNLAPGIPIASSGWTHVAVVKNGNLWTSYANGVQQGQVTDSNPKLPSNTGWTLNGRGEAPFTGLLDEFRITASALTPAQFLNAGSGGGGGGSGSCNYYVNPLTNSLAASGGTGLVLVTTATGCAWTATSNASWITITAGASGTGGGAVSYTVAANSSSNARTGTLTIAGQTHTVTQAGGVSCTYSLQSSSLSEPAAGGSSGVLLNASASSCTWTATSNVSWITISSATSGTGSATISFAVAANTASTSRTGTLTIAGQTFTVTQAAAASSSAPTISSGGVMNAASFVASSLPSGAIAQGSFFSIFGSNLGPATYQTQTSYPIATTLGNVKVTVSQGSTSVNAYLVFVSATQINAIMPSNAPLGNVQLTVSYNGVAGTPAPVTISATNFGIFSTASGQGPGIIQNYVSATQLPLNTRTATATPNQVEILLGTGLGAINAPDNQAPPVASLPVSVQVLVGGQTATVLYSGRMPGVAGVDQINFQLPANVATGCFVPVQVKAGSSYSNTVTMAISAHGETCSDPQNPFASMFANGGKTGSVILTRIDVLAALEAGQAPTSLLLDLGVASFISNPPSTGLSYNPLLSLPPVGSCSALTGSVDVGSLLGSGSGSAQGIVGTDLDAGPIITVTGPKGSVPLTPSDSTAQKSPYGAILGGSSTGGLSDLPPMLDPGATIQISGSGGKDVGAFKTSVNMITGVNWTNRSQLTTIDRSAPLTLNWTGGDASKMILIAGGANDSSTNASAAFFCFVPSAPGSFTIPATLLGNMPANSTTTGFLMLGTLPNGNYPTFNASGLDTGLVFPSTLAASTVAIK